MASIDWIQLPFAFVSPGDVLAAGIVLPLVCLGLAALRFHVRVIQKAPFGIDDWCSAIGSIFIAGIGACFIAGERLGIMGYPTPVPSGTQASEAYGLFIDAYVLEAKIQFAVQFLLAFAYVFVKASIVLFCRRIFVGHKGSPFDWASWIVLGIVILWSAGFLIGGLIFGCGKAVELHWAPLQVLLEAGCDASTPEAALVISDLILDLIILLLPLPSIWTLSMSRQKKLAITGVFLVGLTSISASAARAAIHLTVLYAGYGAGYDINQTVTTLLWWSLLEVALAAIAACLPTLSMLAKDIRLQAFFQRLSTMSGITGSWHTKKSDSEKSGKVHKDADYALDSMDKSPSNPSQKQLSDSQTNMVETDEP
ncbi:putative plasma membrane protein Pth11-like protein [Rosellinia necatrix]|uniref:Putative plasma membrane protein Pth11-like protein n=1 Tax=Rosellinia necatrix TaxID=77044 RepID=A0A1W2TSI3_ROSNE|nr:putative plasma membrane protein Pth11-like protein [Rosellinia necatrix]